jgi:hypothetical protein
VERLDLLVDGDRGVGIITVTSKDMMMGRCVDGGEEWIGREILFTGRKTSLKYVAQQALSPHSVIV